MATTQKRDHHKTVWCLRSFWWQKQVDQLTFFMERMKRWVLFGASQWIPNFARNSEYSSTLS